MATFLFPLGAFSEISMSLDAIMELASRAVQSIDQDGGAGLSRLLQDHGIPSDSYVLAVEQLATGHGIAYPQRLDPAKIFSALLNLKNENRPARSFTSSDIRWGSSVAVRDKALRILAKSIYREITTTGYWPQEVIFFATEILAQVSDAVYGKKK